MYSGESLLEAPERMDILLDNSQTNWENFLDIKDEPLDITDCHVNDVKSESEDDAFVPKEPEVQEDITELNIREVIPTDTSSMIEKTNAISNLLEVPNKKSNNISRGEVPVTRKVIINGQPKTCILVTSPGLKQSIMDSVEKARQSANNPPSPDKSSLDKSNPMVKSCRCTSASVRQHNHACPMVKCSRCGTEVHIDDFRQHIDACPPRKPTPVRPLYHKKSEGSAASKAGQNQTVQAMYNPSTGEVVSLNHNTTKSIVQIPKKVGKITESNFASSKEPNTSSQNSLSINGSCFTNVRSQNNNFAKTSSDISSTLNNNSNLQCMRSSLQPTLDDYLTSVIVENLQANGGCSNSNTNCSEITKFYCNKCDFSSSTLLIMNIHMKKHTQVDSSTLSFPHRPFGNIETLSPATKETIRQVQNLNTSIDINPGNRKSCSGLAASTNVLTISKSAMRDTLLVPNTSTLMTYCDKSPNLTEKNQLNPQQHVKDRGTNCVNLNDLGNCDDISLMRTDCENWSSEQISEETLQGNLRDTIASGCENILSSNNAKSTSEPEEYNQQVPKITRSKSVVAPIIGSPHVSVRTRSKSFSGDKDVNMNKCSGNQQVIEPLRRTRSKSVCARKCAEITNKAAYSSLRSATTTSKCSSANEDKNPTNLVHEFSVGGTTNHPDCREKNVTNLTRARSVLRDCRKSINIQKGQGIENLKTNGSSKNSHNAEPSNRNESVEEVSKTSANSSSVICNTPGNCNIEYINVTDMDEYSPASNLLLLQNNTFSCSVCSFTTDKKRTLTDHERNHRKTNLPIFQCVYCSQRYTRYSLYLHIQDVHPGQKFQIRDKPNKPQSSASHKCSSCSFSTNNRAELLVHTANHSLVTDKNADKCSGSIEVNVLTDKTLTCSICSFSTSDQRQLTAHLVTHPFEAVRSTDASGLAMFCCEYCSYQNLLASKMSYHLNSHMNNRRIKKCPTCQFKSTPQALYCHVQKCPSKSKSCTKLLKPKGSSKRSFSTTKQVKLKLHTKEHSEHKRILESVRQFFNCEMCSYRTSYASDLRAHVKAHKNNPSIRKCQKCNFKSTPPVLRHHARKCNGILKSTIFVSGSKGVSESKEVKKDPPSLNDRTKPIMRVKRSFKSTPQIYPIQKCPSTSKSSTKLVKPTRSYKCSKCSFSTSEQEKLNLHKKEHELKLEPFERILKSGRPFFNCGMCSYGTLHSSDIRCHVKAHEKNPPIINCQNCNFKSTAAVLKFHVPKCNETLKSAIVSDSKVVSESKEVENDPTSLKSTPQASLCHIQKFPSKSKSDSKLPKPKKSYKCSKCSFSTTRQVKLKLHKKKHRLNLAPIKRTLESGRQFFNCRMCSYETSNSSDMHYHVKTHASNPLIMNCLNCNFKSTAAALRNHVRKCNGILKSAIVSDSNGVSESKEVKIDPPNLNVPAKPVMLFKCTKCSFVTHLRIKLKLHIRKRHLKSQSVIKNASSTLVPVERHQEKTLGAKNNNVIKCNYCSFVTTQKGNHVQHMRSHKSHAPMEQCSRCSFKSTPNALRNHLIKSRHNANHTIVKNEQNYQCLSCSFITKNQHAYSNHMKVHQRNKAFKCRLCSLTCSTHPSLISHMNSHRHNQAMKSCSQCNFSSTPRAMKNHICRDQSGKAIPSDNINTEEKLTAEVMNKKLVTDRTPNLDAKKALFQCSLCPFSTSLRIKLNVHSKKHHQSSIPEHFTKIGKRYQCSYCSYTHIRKNFLILHIDTHLKWKMPLKNCKYCDYTSTSPALGTHLLHCKDTLSTTNTPTSSKSNRGKTNTEIISSSSTEEISKVERKHGFTCQLCSYSTDNRGTMDKHMRGHKTNPILHCMTCSYRATPRALAIHKSKCRLPNGKQMTKNNGRVSETQSNKITFKNCNEKEISQKEAANATSPKVFNCPSCSFTSFWLYVIDRHIKSHTLLKLPIKQCAKCDFRSTPVALSAHTKACSGKTGANGSPPRNLELSKSDNSNKTNDLEACDTAGMDKPTITLKDLKTNSSKMYSSRNAPANNTGITNYTLSVRETESRDRDKNNTSNSHSPPKALFSCSNCSFTTNLRIKLKFHLQKNHSESETVNVEPSKKNLKPCTYCSYIPRSKLNWLKHERSHIINKPPIRKCSKCSFRSTKGVLRNHERNCNVLIQA